MEKKSSSDFFKRLFSIGQALPGLPLIFLLVAVVSLLQLPANYLMTAVSKNLGIFVNEIFIIVGIPLAIMLLLGFDLPKLLPFKTPKASMWIFAVLLSVPVAMLIDYSAAASEAFLPLPLKYHEFLNELMTYSGGFEFAIKLSLLCILPGICEEIFFRGICQTTLGTRWGTKTAIIVTAVLFAILHGNPWYFHLYFLLGFFLSWVYAASKTLWIPITCHIINNAWTFTNHALGVKYPLRGFSAPVDVLLVIAGILFAVFFASAFRKTARPSDAS